MIMCFRNRVRYTSMVMVLGDLGLIEYRLISSPASNLSLFPPIRLTSQAHGKIFFSTQGAVTFKVFKGPGLSANDT